MRPTSRADPRGSGPLQPVWRVGSVVATHERLRVHFGNCYAPSDLPPLFNGYSLESNRRKSAPPAGIEQPASDSGKIKISSQSGAESGAVGAHSGEIDADLRAINDTWPTLTEADRRAVLEIICESGTAD